MERKYYCNYPLETGTTFACRLKPSNKGSRKGELHCSPSMAEECMRAWNDSTVRPHARSSSGGQKSEGGDVGGNISQSYEDSRF